MPPPFDYDYLIVGSGFGGSVSALRLTEKGYKVLVVEMGRRWTPETLPKTNWSLNRYLWKPKLGLRGFFNLSFFRHVLVLHGNAVGGGSITYANTMLVPPDTLWDHGTWAGLDDWQRIMPAHYATAKRMLGVVPNLMRDNMHDWVVANENMARVLAAKGYPYQFLFAENAGHVDHAVRAQTLPEALEWLWQDYPH